MVEDLQASLPGDSIMRRFTILTLAVTLGLSVAAQAEDQDAKTVAQDVLDKGAALFDRRDAAVMAATYTEDAQLEWVEKDSGGGGIKIETGRAARRSKRSIARYSRTEKARDVQEHRRIRPVHQPRVDGDPGLPAECREQEVPVRPVAVQEG